MTQAIAKADKDTSQNKANMPRYHVALVEKSKGPGGFEGKNWHRYVLDGVRSPITGYRQGSMKEVKEYAQQCADELNARASGKRSPWAPQQRKVC
jgi:hypothetical protein